MPHFTILIKTVTLCILLSAVIVLQYPRFTIQMTEDEPTIQDIDHLFKIGDKEVDLQGQELVLLIGGTGAGKSTLSKFLRQDSSLKILKNQADDFVFDDGEEKIGNEDNHRSKTLFPQVDKDQQSGAQLVDCAGFEDTRHPMYDLLASFFTQKVFNKAQKMKIVVVESFERMRLSSDRTAFMRTIKQLAQLLQDDVGAFRDSMGLVATKAESNKPDKQLVKSVNAFLEETIKSVEKKLKEVERKGELKAIKALKRQILLLQFLASGEKVAIFRRPDELGNPWAQPPFGKNFDQIRELVFNKLIYLDTNNHQYQVSVAPETVIYIQNEQLGPIEDKLKGLFEKVASYLITKFDMNVAGTHSQFLSETVQKRMGYCQNYLEEFSNTNSPNKLLDFFSAHTVDSSLVEAADLETRKLVFLYTVIGSDIASLENKIANMFGFREAVQGRIESSVNVYSFCSFLVEQSAKYEIRANSKLFQSEITTATYITLISNLLACGIPLDDSANDLKPTSEELGVLNRIRSEMMLAAAEIEKQENYTGYTGRYILASEIKQPDKFKGQLVIKATHKFFLDIDMELIDVHLTVVAPIVEVIGTNRKITLRGSSGATNQSEAATGMNGSHGQPGHISGDITIVALDVTNAKSLQIHSQGGDGADGQAGGNGKDGQKCAVPTVDYSMLGGSKNQINYAVTRQGYEAEWGWSIKENGGGWYLILYNSKTDKETATLSITNRKKGCEKPTNGGDGGSGGAGAPPGTQLFVLKNTDTQIVSSNSSGICGQVGKGGSAGVTVPDCTKVQYMCKGEGSWSNLLLFINLSNNEVKYMCSEPQQSNYCNQHFPDALKGKDGAPGHNVGAIGWNDPKEMSSPEENLNVFQVAFAREKGDELKEFLEFLAAMTDSNSLM